MTRLLTGESFDEVKYNEMYEQKVIAHNLKAPKEQIIDELNEHIKNLDDEIDNFMKPEEKQVSQAIQDVTGIGNTSAQAIISVIGTDMERFPTDKKVQKNVSLVKPEKETFSCGQH